MKYHSGLWKVKSKGAILTLILHYFVSSTAFTLYWSYSSVFTTYASNHVTDLEQYGPLGMASVLLAIFCPITGWLADARLGRYKALRLGLTLMWIGSLTLTSVSMLVGYSVFGDCSKCQRSFHIVGGSVGIVLFAIGLSAYAVNAVQFGIDQMPGASADELSAYIHWFVWVVFAGDFTGELTKLLSYCVPIASNAFIALAIQLMLPNVLLSLALCCILCKPQCLIIEKGNCNSLMIIFRVLKFAINHKYPLNRRAITYCEDEKPSRIDFAKDKYGGPYSTEEVEDVKTFFRIVVLIALTTALCVPLGLFGISYVNILAYMTHRDCSLMALHTTCSLPACATILIPLYMFVIYPIVRKKMLTMLQRVTLAATLTVVLSGAILIIDTIKHAMNPHIACMFTKGSTAEMMKFSRWITIPLCILISADMVTFGTSILEFTCAQSPYSMRGLLTGQIFSICYLAIIVTIGIFLGWENFQLNISPSCDFYYFLFQFVFAVIGLIVLGLVTRWYKRRRRQEEDDQRRIVEGIYDRMLDIQYESERESN